MDIQALEPGDNVKSFTGRQLATSHSSQTDSDPDAPVLHGHWMHGAWAPSMENAADADTSDITTMIQNIPLSQVCLQWNLPAH